MKVIFKGKKTKKEQIEGVDCVEKYTERPLEIGATFKRKAKQMQAKGHFNSRRRKTLIRKENVILICSLVH